MIFHGAAAGPAALLASTTPLLKGSLPRQHVEEIVSDILNSLIHPVVPDPLIPDPQGRELSVWQLTMINGILQRIVEQ